MRIGANDFFKEATLGLALLALAIVGMRIDARSMFQVQAPAILSVEKPAPFCKLDEKKEVISDQTCKVNFKKFSDSLDGENEKHSLKL